MYEENSRPKKMTLLLGDECIELNFEDEQKIQWVELENAVAIESLRLVIDDYYAGTTYEDTCITDIFFYVE